jgi:hypothetical protein
MVSFKDSVGVYSVTLPESVKFDPAAVKKAVGRFKLERTDLKIAGEVAQDDKGVWLTSKAGAKFQLVNRPKKDEKDAPPDVVGKISEGLKTGSTTFSVAGQVKESKETLAVELDSAEAVQKDKK